ncbi:hypothetical protein [Thermomonospora catenispora]|uniref:hypothetical protein n=1 Tax=Thermomonospora catenispora TaxID=2493090 RepID=UPI001121D2C4|nr:hypothetical protein [Thermomonospora catenispora]TNY36262.1 hypothetical protein EIO00_14335 [Thermomonospora catenispora]
MSSMRTGPAARDPQFRGIDPAALGQLIRQMHDADKAIMGWLAAHPPPAGVSAEGHRRAQEVAVWVAEQLSMLHRRHNYAITRPDPAGGVRPGPTPPPRSPTPRTGGDRGAGNGPRPVAVPPKAPSAPRLTPHGAGPDLGAFPDQRSAHKAARSDALAVARAERAGGPLPEGVWRRLEQNAGDPDYTAELYERLGPAGTAALIRRAAGEEARLEALSGSLGTASFHLGMNTVWLRTLLTESQRLGVRDTAEAVLLRADMSPRTDQALARLGVLSGAGCPTPAGRTS